MAIPTASKPTIFSYGFVDMTLYGLIIILYLVVQAIRSWLENDPLAKTGWLGALQDSQIGQAVALIHRYLTFSWSLQSLAERVGLSRSAFAARFMSLIGEPPMHYVRQWRFQVAVGWLGESDLPIAEMVDQLGYQS